MRLLKTIKMRLFFIKIYLQILQFFAPNKAVKVIYKFISIPRIKKRKQVDTKIMSSAIISEVVCDLLWVKQYEWNKSSNQTIMLVHGWEGSAKNFEPLISDLINNDYHVIAFDAPAHGESKKGKTHMFEFGFFLAKQLKEISPQFFISHSFGSVSIAMALIENMDLVIDRWLLITTPYTFKSRMNRIADKFGVNKTVLSAVEKKIEEDTGKKISDLDMVKYCQQFDQVKNMLIIHSKQDKVLPIDWSRKVCDALPQCSLIELEKSGHFSILSSLEAKAIINDYFYSKIELKIS